MKTLKTIKPTAGDLFPSILLPGRRRRKRRMILAGLAGLLWATGVWVFGAEEDASEATDPSPHAAYVGRAVEVVEAWKPHQHLYVKGNLGVSTERLNELESWLDVEATHWTVVLVESGGDERFTDLDGRTFEGVDAVEQALGTGLPNRTDFGKLREPRTGESNGAFFILFLMDRKLSYYGSEAQDRRGLGEDRWPGNLDRHAVAAMRSGGRVIDAAKDTITSIDRLLDQKITAEFAEKERQVAAEKAARQAALRTAQASLNETADRLALLETKVGELNRAQQGLSGDLARPDLERMKSELETARSRFESGEAAAVTLATGKLRLRAEGLIRAIEEYERAPREFSSLAAEIERQSQSAHAAAGEAALERARQALAQAEVEHERGDSGYDAYLGTAKLSLASAAEVIRTASRSAAIRRRAASAAGIGLSILLLGSGWMLNRRRRSAKREADELLTTWRSGLGEKTSALFELLDRTRRVVGASKTEAAERYAGRTLELSEQTIANVDELFIMSACSGRVLRDAERLVEPAGFWRRAINLFAAGSYRAGVRLLRDEPIAFRPGEALDLVVRGPRTERDSLLGEIESYRPFTMTFTELIAEFNRRAGQALAALEMIESSLLHAAPVLDELGTAIESARQSEAEVCDPDDGGGFGLPGVYAELLPSARAERDQGAGIATRDPVGAVEIHGRKARQRVDDALGLINFARDLRTSLLPGLEETASELQKTGRSTGWIEAAIVRLWEDANELAIRACSAPVSVELSELRKQAEGLREKAATAAVLETRRGQLSEEVLQPVEALIGEVRDGIGKSLGIAAERVLREPESDPSDYLGRSRDQMTSAQAELDRGEVVLAGSSLDEAEGLAEEARAIVRTTQEAFENRKAKAAALRNETERLTGLLPEHERMLATIVRDYAPAVLTLGEGDPSHPNANGTIADNLVETREHLQFAGKLLDNAVDAFATARILEASELLRQVEARQEASSFRLLEITDKKKRLAEADAANALRLETLDGNRSACQPEIHRSTTMAATLETFREAGQCLGEIRIRLDRPGSDPFEIERELERAERLLTESTARAQSDRAQYQEAERSLQIAGRQLEAAERLAREASTDNIQDSPTIMRARRELDFLTGTLLKARQELERPHRDWNAVDAEADRIAAQASAQAATLRHELEACEAATSAITRAAEAVRLARGWSGAYGVLISGSAGSDLLLQARELLHQGHYSEAGNSAEGSCRVAASALHDAQARVAMLRRAEEERIERDRRRRRAEETARQRRMSSSSSGGIGSIGHGPRHSGFSVGSGARRSGFSRGSGVGRSGW